MMSYPGAAGVASPPAATPVPSAGAGRRIAEASAWVAAAGSAELVLVFIDLLAGVVLHAFLVAILLGRYVLHPRGLPLPVLALPSIMRLLSLSMPTFEVPLAAWYALIGAPLIVAAAMALRVFELPPSQIGLGSTRWRRQAAIAAGGLPLGIALYQASDATALRLLAQPIDDVVTGVIVIGFVALGEEVVFRGVMQQVLARSIGYPAIGLVAIVYTVMFLGTGSPELALTMGGIGLLFGVATAISRSLWGVSVAHALMLLTAITIWPALLA